MRITTGLYKGFKLEMVPGTTTRPTQDKIRQAVFNSLFLIEGRILDLFAGTGAYGLEALSRGANHAVLVDHEASAIKTIRKNALKMNQQSMTIIKSDYRDFIQKNQAKFDIIFLDPPYQLFENIHLNSIIEQVNMGGRIVLETAIETNIELPNNCINIFSKTYGNKKIMIIKKAAN